MHSDFLTLFHENAGYVEEMFARYQQDPQGVREGWRGFFEGFHLGFGQAAALIAQGEGVAGEGSCDGPASAESIAFELKAAAFVCARSAFGHRVAQVNPLATDRLPLPPSLTLEAVGLADSLHRMTHAGTIVGLPPLTLGDLVEALDRMFSGAVSIEFEHIPCRRERQWLLQEFQALHTPLGAAAQEAIYRDLATADAFEKTIATKYIGKKRFSMEGADFQLLAAEAFLDEVVGQGAEEVTVGIAHRGRLNLLVNLIKKPFADLIAEWEGKPHEGLQGDGDVKYHFGYESERTTRSGTPVRIALSFNPSHLEYVDCVIPGETRARQVLYHQGEQSKVVPLVFHGDAAIAGQGVVYETAQMMKLEGYSVGGTVHVVANNQVGFTTDPKDARSSMYATDVAKVTASPVFHVNADEPELVEKVMRLAARYRQNFNKDIYIDVLCFRRYGHNEGDEPQFTQPVLYETIKKKPAPYESYAAQLCAKGDAFNADSLKAIYNDIRNAFNAAYDAAQAAHAPIKQFIRQREAGKLSYGTEAHMLAPLKTAVGLEKLKELGEIMGTLPSGFQAHPKLSRIVIADRQEMIKGDKKIEWGLGELLAYASLLEEGYSVRLMGEDVQRGTFAHRHVTLVDVQTGARYNTLSPFAQRSGARVDVHNSLLSEEAAMGYEYGYATVHPRSLVVWEAQFGDFANGAQVIIDQFIAAGETKWCQSQGLVLLLPHGWEGQGPEHSSARLERFLQLCAQGNMVVGNLTSAAQLFHALRRQLLWPFRKPLVLMTPKAFLRSPRVSSQWEEFTQGHFQEILDDARIADPKGVERVLFCTGKVALELLDALEKEEAKSLKTAVVRVEQMYPLHTQRIQEVLKRYSQARTVAWVQEEPANMGAWSFMAQHLAPCVASHKAQKLIYVGRSARPSPAVGLEKRHLIEQAELIAAAFSKVESHFV